ncbi:hypothetical protein San01_43350 [Streptomyces angustmyceticus]|uniref:Uncharacterized protein n=1 Tax=Streptomyces angustmyceticus TaxID=285578 RepID=A0A5J4LMR4_9ACTN|nr:hypothetical protein San01_43350 [Streptomyces angustmyceticus]
MNRRSTPRHRSAASPAVPSVGPSTSRTLSTAQSNCSASSRRWIAWAVARSRIQPVVIPKYRSQPTHTAASSSDSAPQGAPPAQNPARSSSGSTPPAVAPAAAPSRSARAPRRLASRPRRYQSALRSAPSSHQR